MDAFDDEEFEGIEDLELFQDDERLPDAEELELDEIEEVSQVEDEQDATPPQWGQVVDTVDLDNDGYAEVTMRDADGNGRTDYVEGDLNDDGFLDITLQDTDGDGISERTTGGENWELLSDSNIEDLASINRDEPHLDSDRDGVTNFEEAELGTDILDADTDGDMVGDNWELNQGSDPTDWASTQDAGLVAEQAEYEVEQQLDVAATEIESYDTGLDTSYDGGYDAGTDYSPDV